MDTDFDVTSAMTNRMSLFYAHATPMLTVLSDATSRFVAEVHALLFLYLCLFLYVSSKQFLSCFCFTRLLFDN